MTSINSARGIHCDCNLQNVSRASTSGFDLEFPSIGDSMNAGYAMTTQVHPRDIASIRSSGAS